MFPHLGGLQFDGVTSTRLRVGLDVRTREEPVTYPDCGMSSRGVHSRYRRRLSDTALSGREVVIRLRVRRLFCDNTDCGRTTFAEQPPKPAGRYAWRTTILQRLLCAVALALGGRPGARMSRQLTSTVSRMTLLRQIRALPDPEPVTPRVLGVDDFALRRGHRYATILIDIESRRPVEVLGDRTAETLADWLCAHPGVEIVCRDRAGAYAEGVTTGAQLGLARGTVRRFARAADVEEPLVHNGTGRRVLLLDPFTPYLHRRWNEGCTNATQLFGEIRDLGYRGGKKTVLNYLHLFRVTGHIPRPAPKPPSVRRVACWIMSNHVHVPPDDQRRSAAPRRDPRDQRRTQCPGRSCPGLRDDDGRPSWP
nr:transposase [Nocardia brevicatena]